MIGTADISKLLDEDTKKILSNAVTTIVNDLMLFDEEIDANSLVVAGEVAKAIDALFKDKTYIDRADNRYEPAQIQNFLNLHQATLQEIAGILLGLGETDLFNAVDGLGKICFKETWKIATASVDVEKALLESENTHIILYKAKSGELAIRFPNEKTRDQFLFGLERAVIPVQFRIGSQYDYNPEGYTPTIYEGQNNRVFIPSYKAAKGEFGVNCGSAANRALIIKLMGLNLSGTKNYHHDHSEIYGDGLFTIYHNAQQSSAIYFNSENPIFNEPGTLIKINTSTGEIVQSKIKNYGEIANHKPRGTRFDYAYEDRAQLSALDLELVKAKSIIAPKKEAAKYSFICSEESLNKIRQYKQDLISQTKVAGIFLQKELADKNLSLITDEQFVESLIATKPDQIFAESTFFGPEVNWNEIEIGLLGDISCVIPTQAYDDGAWSNPVVHQNPLPVTLVYVPGPLLRSPSNSSAQPDMKEVCPLGIFDKEAYYGMIERRLLPGLLNVNAKAAEAGDQLFITLPGIGCGQFSGAFHGRIHAELEEALRRLFATHGQKLTNVRALWFDNFDKQESTSHIHGIDFLVRPLRNGGLPQLCNLAAYGAQYAHCKLVSFVAWDHVSKPGNDYWGGARATDDGVKGAATDTMPCLTGIEGVYVGDRVVPKENQGATWSAICAEKGGIRLTVDTNNFATYAFNAPAGFKIEKKEEEVKIILPVPEIKLEEAFEEKEQAPISCRISANNDPSLPQLYVEFPSRDLRDRWHRTFVGLAAMLGLAINEESLIVISKENPSLLTIKSSMGMGSSGVYLAKQNNSPAHFQQTRQVAVDFGDEQLRAFVVASFGITAGEAHTSASIGLERTVYFRRNVLNQEGASFIMEFNEDELLQREYFLLGDDGLNMGY